MKLLLGKHIFVSTDARFGLSKNLVYPRKWKIPRFCHLFIFRETDRESRERETVIGDHA